MSNIYSWIEAHERFKPEKIAIVDEQQTYTYAQLAASINTSARMLKHQLRIGRGDRLAYLGLNGIEFISLLFACARLGAIFVPLNWRLETPEYDYILANASPKALIVTSDFNHQVASLNEAYPDCRFVLQGAEQDHWESYAVLQDASDVSEDSYNTHVELQAPLLIVYTSGTTGRPKGAVLTQEAMFYNALNSQHMHDMTSNDTILTVLPMFHVGGLNIQTLPALYVGATVILHQRFDPEKTLAAISEQQPSLTVLVPATLSAILNSPQWHTTSLSSLRSITTGSSLVPAQLIETISSRGLPVQQVYGLTETSPIAVYQTAEQAKGRSHSTGMAALHCHLRIVAADGVESPHGHVGRVLIKGPNILFEYWGNPQATAAALDNGWFDTGDLGHLDEDGHLVIDDRAKDMIISGGENIYPAELEGHLHNIDGVLEAAVVGRPDAKWGETPVAMVVLEHNSVLDKDTILKSFIGQLARFKHPNEVMFLPKLPRNVMGKVQKFVLREMILTSATK